MMNISMTTFAYFLTDTLNWQGLRDKEKSLLDSLHEKLKNKNSWKQM